MRILQVHTPYRDVGGEDVVVRAEAELLRRRGHVVEQHSVPNPTGATGTVAALSLSPWNPVANQHVRRAVTAGRPDVAHVHNTWFAQSPSVIRALRASGVPVVMTLHNYRLICAGGSLLRDGVPCEVCVGSQPWPGVRHRCYRGSIVLSAAAATTIAVHRGLGTWTRDVDVFLSMNDDARRLFIEGGLPGERIRVKPNFVADPGPRRQPPSRSNTVLSVGRLTHEKGVDLLVDAWARLPDTSLELVLLGEGPLRAELEARHVPGVRFAGQVSPSEVRSLMLSARALALPSRCYEGADPLAGLEAFAAGLPVLSSAIGGRIDLLAPCGEEWLVPTGPASQWVEPLRRLCDAELVEEGGRRCRALFEARFTEDRAAQTLEDAYAAARERHGWRDGLTRGGPPD